jgi:cytochrome c553
MKRGSVFVALATSCGLALSAHAQDASVDTAKAEQTAVNVCSTCHGPRGVSTSPEFPILAAQREGYIAAQLEAFRSHARAEKDAHDFMWGIAGQLDPAVIRGLARYYASQPAAPGRVDDPALVAKGKALFDAGVPGRGVPACATCHGANAEGGPEFPRLAGQHAKYVAKQLAYIQTLVRAAPVMHGIVKDFTPAEIQAVAAYVQSR